MRLKVPRQQTTATTSSTTATNLKKAPRGAPFCLGFLFQQKVKWKITQNYYSKESITYLNTKVLPHEGKSKSTQDSKFLNKGLE